MRYLLLALIFVAGSAGAQTIAPYPDVQMKAVSGSYPIGCKAQDDADMAELCFARVDGPVVLEYGCHPAGPSAVVRTELDVIATSNRDATIKCYALDTEGLVSDYSSNSGFIDFTRPGAPQIIIARRFPSCERPVFVFRS
jgi:hypothetical protein